MKILITGAAGQLGTELRRQLEQGKSALGEIPEKLRRATVLCTDIGVEGMRELDITNRHEVAAFVRHHQPDVIICCAAYTNVDGCETHREDAFRVNALGPRNLAMAAEEIGAKLIHVSTDYVFSGVDNGGVALDEACGTCPVRTNNKVDASPYTSLASPQGAFSLYCSKAANPKASSGSKAVPARRAALMEKFVMKRVSSFVTRKESGEMPKCDIPKEFIRPKAEITGWQSRLAVFQDRVPPAFST